MIAVIAGLFGMTIGSFLNVCSIRWSREQSVVRSSSHCPGCGNPVHWYDNVPVLAWFWLRGRCRDCRAPFSIGPNARSPTRWTIGFEPPARISFETPSIS